jgi:hypothetical protein
MYRHTTDHGTRGAWGLLGRGALFALAAVVAVLLCSGAFAGGGGDGRGGGPPRDSEDEEPVGRWRRARGQDTRQMSGEQIEELRKLQSLGYLAGSTPMPSETGVVYLEAEHAQPGLNFFTSGHFPGAVLMDMEGNVLHEWEYAFLRAWPNKEEDAEADGADYWRWAYLFPNGDVLAIFEGLGLIKVDKDSNLLWKHWGGEHHDLEVTEDGEIYVLTRKAHTIPEISRLPILEDFVTILDPQGRKVREVSVLDAFANSAFSGAPEARDRPKRGDIYHTNAIEVLDGRLADRIPAFRKGNVLLSMRQLSTIAVLDMATEQIVWVSSGMWLEQHDPKVLENGNIMLFDNKGDDGKSKIIEFDPVTKELAWAYHGTEQCVFFTKMCGAAHRLPNGNTIISESDYGRAFEVTPEGFIVWEFLNPNRAGETGELIATLFDVARLPEDFPTDWLN